MHGVCFDLLSNVQYVPAFSAYHLWYLNVSYGSAWLGFCLAEASPQSLTHWPSFLPKLILRATSRSLHRACLEASQSCRRSFRCETNGFGLRHAEILSLQPLLWGICSMSVGRATRGVSEEGHTCHSRFTQVQG